MAEKFRNKYRIQSARLRSWNYRSSGLYFVTICTLNREFLFGKILDGKMHLNEIGEIAEQQWVKTPEMRPDMNLELDAFVIMPNHFHGIIMIGKNQYNSDISDISDICRDAMHCVSTNTTGNSNTTVSTPEFGDISFNAAANQFKPQSKNLASIIRGFKSAVTTQVKKSGNCDFAWQSRYHEHIIRNISEFYSIRKYIINNPANTENDQFYC